MENKMNNIEMHFCMAGYMPCHNYRIELLHMKPLLEAALIIYNWHTEVFNYFDHYVANETIIPFSGKSYVISHDYGI